MIQIFDNTMNALYLLTLYVYPFLIFFVIWNIMSNQMSQRAWKVSFNILLDIREE